jgi:transcriptional regulator with XRE-family HTH domain
MIKARNYTSNLLDELLSEITPEEQRKTDKRMVLAMKIDEAMKAKGWKKIDLAREMNKKPSVITRWLSGTHNFESDTLFDLEDKLGINLVNIGEKAKDQIIHYHISYIQKISTEENYDRIFDLAHTYSLSNVVSNNKAEC